MKNVKWMNSWFESVVPGSPEQFFTKPNDRLWFQINAREKRKLERGLINPFDEIYMDIMKHADTTQHLNWEAPEQLKQILSWFLPHHSRIEFYHPDTKWLPRKLKKKISRSPLKKVVVSHTEALKKVLQQISEDIKESRIHSMQDPAALPIDFSGARQFKEENKNRMKKEDAIRADMYRSMAHLGLPKKIFFTAPMHYIEELVIQYKKYPESTVTMKNYTYDMIHHSILPEYAKRDTNTFEKQNQTYQKLVDLCFKVCFSHKNREWNLHPYLLTSFVVDGDEPWLKISDVRGALSEAYGKYVLENMHNYIPESAFVCKPLPMQDSARRILDLHAKSDAVYKVTSSDNTEMLWAVDFKNRGERKEAWEVYSSLDIEENEPTSVTSMYDRNDLTNKLRRNLRTDKTIPVKWMLLYMWLPKSFHEMHFTPSMIQADAEHFYNQLLQASTNSSSPTQ